MSALYDPKPVPELAQTEGEWQGTLTYKDYQDPTLKVTLQTMLEAALATPSELTLHYIFDDGPKKIVHSYEGLALDLPQKTLTWLGLKPSDTAICRIASVEHTGETLTVIAEMDRIDEGTHKWYRYHVTLGPKLIKITKDDGTDPKMLSFRDEYVFHRVAPKL